MDRFSIAFGSISLGDILFLVVLVLFLIDLIRSQILMNQFGRFFLFYIILLLLTSLLNSSLYKGAFLNIFRTNLLGFTFYTYIYSIVANRKLKLKTFAIGIAILCLAFVYRTLPEIRKTWSQQGFAVTDIFESSLNLNTWGFTLLLFFFTFLLFWNHGLIKYYSIVGAIFIGSLIILSFSRNAIALLLLNITWVMIYIYKRNLKKLIFPALIALVIYFAVDLYKLIGIGVTDKSLLFFSNKTNAFFSDVVDTRLYYINITPIKFYFDKFSILQLFIGDGVSVQHSFLSNTLIVSGIIGFFIFFTRFVWAYRFAIKSKERYDNSDNSKFLMLFIIIFLVNDFITNTSFFLPISSYISYIIFGFLFGIAKRESMKKDYIVAQIKKF